MVPPCSDRIARVPPYSYPIVLSTCTGLSPIVARLSILFQFLHVGHWPSPRSLATTSGVSVDVLSSGYLDVSVPRVRLYTLWIQMQIPLRVGFPIRKCPDQSLLAAPRTLSQRATSFIASQCQGIHQMPFLTLDRRLLQRHAQGQTRSWYSATIKDASCWTRTPETDPTMVAHGVPGRGPFRIPSVTNPLHDVQDPCPGSPRTVPFPKKKNESLITTFVVRPARRAALLFKRGTSKPAAFLKTHLMAQSAPAETGGGERDRTDDLMLAKHALSQLSYAPGMLFNPPLFRGGMVGQGGLEPPTSRLSSARSNQLSY